MVHVLLTNTEQYCTVNTGIAKCKKAFEKNTPTVGSTVVKNLKLDG